MWTEGSECYIHGGEYGDCNFLCLNFMISINHDRYKRLYSVCLDICKQSFNSIYKKNYVHFVS